MKRLVLGILLASLGLYVWGFLFWGVTELPYHAWKSPRNSASAARELRRHFPENGTYFLPAFQDESDPDKINRMYREGPVGFVHITAANGRPAMDLSIMLQGLVLNTLFAVLCAALLQYLHRQQFGYWDNVRLMSFLGLIAVLLVDGGQIVWWSIDWQWKLTQGLYNWSVFLVTGLILSAFLVEKADLLSSK